MGERANSQELFETFLDSCKLCLLNLVKAFVTLLTIKNKLKKADDTFELN